MANEFIAKKGLISTGDITVIGGEITSKTGDVKINPKSGSVVISNIKYPNFDGTKNQVLTTDGAGVLSWATVSSESNPMALSDLVDVSIPTTPATNSILRFDGTKWIAGSSSGAGTVTSVTVASKTSAITVTNGTVTTEGTIELELKPSNILLESLKDDLPAARVTGLGPFATKTSVDWNSATDIINKPTTLSGYGITDAQPLDADLTAIAGLSSTGYLKRTGNDTWTLETGDFVLSDHELDIKGDVVGKGTVSSVTVSLPNIPDLVAGSYAKVSINEKGQVISGQHLVNSDLPVVENLTAGAKVKPIVNDRGIVTGSESLLASDLPTHKHDIVDINATGTPSSNTYLRGDGSWSPVSGGGGSTIVTYKLKVSYAHDNTIATVENLPEGWTTEISLNTLTLNTTLTEIPLVIKICGYQGGNKYMIRHTFTNPPVSFDNGVILFPNASPTATVSQSQSHFYIIISVVQ